MYVVCTSPVQSSQRLGGADSLHVWF